MCSWLGFHFAARKQRKVATKLISYKRYEDILFQKVALCYLLHFVKDESSKNILGTWLLHINLRNPKVTRPDVHLGVPKKHKIATNIISYKRYREILFQKVVLCYLLHFVQDGSSKNALENCFSAKMSKIENWEKNVYIPPVNSRSTAPLRRLFMLV